MAEPGEDLIIGRAVRVSASEMTWRFSASGGPGGQHANRSRTRVELRLDIRGCPAFSEHQRSLLVERFGPELRVVVDDERSQLRNRDIARERLAARIAGALVPQRTRTATRATRASQRRRVEAKKRRGDVKRQRRRPGHDD